MATPTSYDVWLKAVDSFLRTRTKYRVRNIEPSYLQAGFDSGTAPLQFVTSGAFIVKQKRPFRVPDKYKALTLKWQVLIAACLIASALFLSRQHSVADYAGTYTDPAYPKQIIKIDATGKGVYYCTDQFGDEQYLLGTFQLASDGKADDGKTWYWTDGQRVTFSDHDAKGTESVMWKR